MAKVGDQWCQLNSDVYYVSDYDMTVAFYSKFPSWGSWVARGSLAVGARRRSSARRSSSIFDTTRFFYFSEPRACYISILVMLFIQKFALFLSLHYVLLHQVTPPHHFAWRWLRISWWVRKEINFGFEHFLICLFPREYRHFFDTWVFFLVFPTSKYLWGCAITLLYFEKRWDTNDRWIWIERWKRCLKVQAVECLSATTLPHLVHQCCKTILGKSSMSTSFWGMCTRRTCKH